MSSMSEIFGDPISVYTRAQAIEDGTLVDVTEWASADKGFIGGFKIPVALTAALWAKIETFDKRCLQDVRGRAHDVLWTASLAARSPTAGPSRIFSVLLSNRKLRLRMEIGGGDNGEPVITIGLPEDF